MTTVDSPHRRATRRFKQLIETGEIARSRLDADGHLLAEHLKQRPAQPLEVAS